MSKTPEILKPLAKSLVWDIKTEYKEVFLTFDDGPVPEVTPHVLNLLERYQAKATFFCVGQNIERSGQLFEELKSGGHAVGNHSHDHNNGWKVNHVAYLKSYLACQKLTGGNLFRPPYGKITRAQVSAISQRSNIIMWDVLSGDFDPKSTAQACLDRVIKHTEPGSIIVMHDNVKSKDKMLYALEGALEHLSAEGFLFSPIQLKGLKRKHTENP